MIDSTHIGFTTAPTSVTIDAWRVKLFCQAIGETDRSPARTRTAANR